MGLRRVHTLLLASAGVLLGHIAGYSMADPSAAQRELSLGAHAYLGMASIVLIPLGLTAALAMGIRSVRAHGRGLPTARDLAVTQVGLFALLEVLERIPGPGSPTDVFAARAVWFGAAAQLLVAIAVAWLVRFTALVARQVLGSARRRLAAPAIVTDAVCDLALGVTSISRRLPRRRGPPRLAAPVLV